MAHGSGSHHRPQERPKWTPYGHHRCPGCNAITPNGETCGCSEAAQSYERPVVIVHEAERMAAKKNRKTRAAGQLDLSVSVRVCADCGKRFTAHENSGETRCARCRKSACI